MYKCTNGFEEYVRIWVYLAFHVYICWQLIRGINKNEEKITNSFTVHVLFSLLRTWFMEHSVLPKDVLIQNVETTHAVSGKTHILLRACIQIRYIFTRHGAGSGIGATLRVFALLNDPICVDFRDLMNFHP